MSLLLTIIRQLLEYYGVPLELVLERCEVCLYGIAQMFGPHHSLNTFCTVHIQQLCAISRSYLMSWPWKTKKYGSTRSFVRRLGKILSLDPCPRARFQLVQCLNFLESDQHRTVSSVTPSLADVLWIANDREPSARYRFDDPEEAVLLSTVSLSASSKASVVNEETVKKISALEDELSHLRAQIAAIVSGSRNDHQSCSDAVNSSNAPWNFPQSGITSTPVPISSCNTTIPPPPPLPITLSSEFDPHISTIELIKRRTASKIKDTANRAGCQKVEAVPSMTDVLKDINKVKLRAVEKSPGGTPLPKTKKVIRLQWDPAALIANALKEKFAAHSNSDDSFDKENRTSDVSPFSSPETPIVGRHILKPNIKR